MYRSRDILISLLLLFIFSIPMIVISIYLFSIFGKKLIFRDLRVGLEEKEFICYKFKTMYDEDVPHNSPLINSTERRIIKFGRFLRRHRFDELPQLFNVLQGSLSLVGPRPEQKHLVDIYLKEIANFGIRHSVKPGLTGLAQIKQGHVIGEDATKIKLRWDLSYIEKRSFANDLCIIFHTVLTVISGKGGK
jgi:UDP-GalNAc:undecaprenyl-phosphate GalNAc-1-phosphate transferase